MKCWHVYHEWKGDGSGLDTLDDPHESETDYLGEGKEMNSGELDVSQVDIVRLIFDRHQHNQQTIIELHTQRKIHIRQPTCSIIVCQMQYSQKSNI